MNTKITAKTKKRIEAAIAKLTRELDKSNMVLRALADFRSEFDGFELLESAKMKTYSHENVLLEKQKWVRIAIETFEGLTNQKEALSQLSKPQHQNAHRDLEAENLTILGEGRHFKNSWKDDKKFLAKVAKSRKTGFEGQLTFFK